MKNILLFISLLILTGCSSTKLIIQTPSYGCEVELPSDRELDIFRFHPENNNAFSKKRCEEERTTCPQKYFEYLEIFSNFKEKVQANYRSSSIMLAERKKQKTFCFTENPPISKIK